MKSIVDLAPTLFIGGALLIVLGGPVILLTDSALGYTTIICVGLWLMTWGFSRGSRTSPGFHKLSEHRHHVICRFLLTFSILTSAASIGIFLIKVFGEGQ